jgi:hypothetical protein
MLGKSRRELECCTYLYRNSFHLSGDPAFFGVRSCLSVKSDAVPICTETVFIFQEILRAKSDTGLNTCWVNLAVNWNAVHICTETDSIIWGIPRAESDSAASLQCDCRSIV